MDKDIAKAAEIIRNIEYINIATITPAGEPWNTPVYSAYDKKLNFYWMSWKENQHSVNVRNHSNIFMTIYDSTVPSGTGFGLYFQGRAFELDNPKEIITGLSALYGRTKGKMRAITEFLKHFPRRVYKFTPEKVWINQVRGVKDQFIDIRKELDLKKLLEKL